RGYAGTSAGRLRRRRGRRGAGGQHAAFQRNEHRSHQALFARRGRADGVAGGRRVTASVRFRGGLRMELSELKFETNGLIPVVVQDAESGEVLMVAHMNREALQRTIDTGRAWYWSRSRQ